MVIVQEINNKSVMLLAIQHLLATWIAFTTITTVKAKQKKMAQIRNQTVSQGSVAQGVLHVQMCWCKHNIISV